MKVLIATDSFKGSLSSSEAGEAIKEGIIHADVQADITIVPVADGGEGTAKTLTNGMGGLMQSLSVTGPLGDPVCAEYGIINGRLAVMEMSAAAGLTLVETGKRNPLHTTTYGVGEMIRDAINKGIRHFIIGIGGSSTNDGGAGMLQALGYGLLNEQGEPINPGAEGLSQLSSIRTDEILPELMECKFRIACDVINPLCGGNGASAIYGPQKGASPEMIGLMDEWLGRYAGIASEINPDADPCHPGSGAAGGLGFAFHTFLNASLEPGIKIVMEVTGLEERIKDADIIITGEGRLDRQTVMGKVPVGVAELAGKHGKPVVAFAGSLTPEAKLCNELGIDAFFPIIREITSLDKAMNPETAKRNLADTAEQVFRLLKIKTSWCYTG